MSEPIEYFGDLATLSFFSNVDARYNELDVIFSKRYDGAFTNGKKTFYYDIPVGPEAKEIGEVKEILEKGNNYCERCYEFRENKVQKEIEIVIGKNPSTDEIKAFIKIQLNGLSVLETKLNALKVDKKLEYHKKTILERLLGFKNLIMEKYLSSAPNHNSTPKIRWRGDLKVLTTLFFELLNGQEKGIGATKRTTPSLLEADKKDIENLLLNNFLNAEGNPLRASTISDYLNKSKPQHRVPKDERLEFPE